MARGSKPEDCVSGSHSRVPRVSRANMSSAMDAANPSSDRAVLVLSPSDNVGVAIRDLTAGERLNVGAGTVAVTCEVLLGHKVALKAIARGEKVVKYAAPIGSATCDISPGEHVHTHNLKSDYTPTFTLDGANPYLKPQE